MCIAYIELNIDYQLGYSQARIDFEVPGFWTRGSCVGREGLERFGERKFVGVGVFYVEVAFAPRRIGRLGRWRETGLYQTGVESIDIVNVEDQAAPPDRRYLLVSSAVQDEVQEPVTDPKAGEGCRIAAVEHLHAYFTPVEIHGPGHVGDGQGDCADGLNVHLDHPIDHLR
jgi:hypothetical protein